MLFMRRSDHAVDCSRGGVITRWSALALLVLVCGAFLLDSRFIRGRSARPTLNLYLTATYASIPGFSRRSGAQGVGRGECGRNAGGPGGHAGGLEGCAGGAEGDGRCAEGGCSWGGVITRWTALARDPIEEIGELFHSQVIFKRDIKRSTILH